MGAIVVRIRFTEMLGVKEARERRRIPITEVARKLDLSRQTISRFISRPEMERLDMDTVNKLCDYFECTFYELIEVTEKPKQA
jgi:DNA-binding Xre family transcriptional regulator